MISKPKVKEAVCSAIAKHLGTLADRGFSLKDDTDGQLILIDSVKQHGQQIEIQVIAVDDNDQRKDFAFTISLSPPQPPSSVVKQDDTIWVDTNAQDEAG